MSDDFNLFAEIMAADRQTKMVPFPIKHPTKGPFDVPMQLLTPEETAIAESRAAEKASKLFKDGVPKKDSSDYESYQKVLQKFEAAEILYKAVRNPADPKKPFFPRAEDILNGKNMNIDHIAVLINHYNDIQTNLEGLMSEGKMTDEVVKEWTERLIRDGSKGSFLLNSFSLGSLKILLMSLVDQLKTLQSPNVSSITPQDSGTKKK